MITRRAFGKRAGLLFVGASAFSEFALAQRAVVLGKAPPGTIWINANEHPDGPCAAAREIMVRALPDSGRYHYQEFQESIYSAIARSEGLDASQILVGAGSSEILHIAVEVFTSPERPLVTSEPTYELPPELAKISGRSVVKVPLTKTYAADVKRLVEEAAKAKAGMIYVCNPNNPTSSITPRGDLAWLVSNLPPDTVLLVDEAYIHFSGSPDLESAIPYVKQNKNVIVARTFSKIYGMAGLRVGFGIAKPDLIAQMRPYRVNVVSIVSARAAVTSLNEAPTLVPQRREKLMATRNALCSWLREKNLRYIEPHANFMMINIGRDVRSFLPKMLEKGVAVGRPFPPYDQMLRVTIGTDREMATFRQVFWELMS